MASPTGPYIRVPESYHGDEDLRSVSKGARYAWVALTCWSKQMLKDGYFNTIAMGSADVTQAEVEELIRINLVVTKDRGYELVGYEQKTKAEVEDSYSQRQSAGKRGGQASGETRRRQAEEKRNSPANTNGEPESRSDRHSPGDIPVPYTNGKSKVHNHKASSPPPPKPLEPVDGFRQAVGFDEVYEAYPPRRSDDRRDLAQAAYCSVVADIETHQRMLAAANYRRGIVFRWSPSRQGSVRFVSKWILDGYWQEDYEKSVETSKWRPANSPGADYDDDFEECDDQEEQVQ